MIKMITPDPVDPSIQEANKKIFKQFAIIVGVVLVVWLVGSTIFRVIYDNSQSEIRNSASNIPHSLIKNSDADASYVTEDLKLVPLICDFKEFVRPQQTGHYSTATTCSNEEQNVVFYYENDSTRINGTTTPSKRYIVTTTNTKLTVNGEEKFVTCDMTEDNDKRVISMRCLP